MKIHDFPMVELERGVETHRFPTRLDWRVMLVLAEIGGWEPLDRSAYESTSLLTPGLMISDTEARDLGSALANMLDDVPDFDIPFTGRIIPLEYFSGVRKAQITAFTAFCLGGGFEIL